MIERSSMPRSVAPKIDTNATAEIAMALILISPRCWVQGYISGGCFARPHLQSDASICQFPDLAAVLAARLTRGLLIRANAHGNGQREFASQRAVNPARPLTPNLR